MGTTPFLVRKRVGGLLRVMDHPQDVHRVFVEGVKIRFVDAERQRQAAVQDPAETGQPRRVGLYYFTKAGQIGPLVGAAPELFCQHARIVWRVFDSNEEAFLEVGRSAIFKSLPSNGFVAAVRI